MTHLQVRSYFFWLIALALGLSACQPVSAARPAVTITAVQISPAAATSAPPDAASAASPTPASREGSIWLADTVPPRLRDTLKLPAGWKIADKADRSSLSLDALSGAGASQGTVQWIYALVAPFPTVTDELTLSDLQAAWKGGASKETPFTGLLVEPSTAKLFEKLWGPAAAFVQVRPAGQLVDAAWTAKTAWAIVPFEQVEPRWKVIAVDGQSPLRKDFDPSRYGLSVNFTLQGDPATLGSFQAQGSLPGSNRRVDRLTTVVVTGVTALVRGTASLMEMRGMDYPAQDIGDWLRSADILHISNEVAFAKNCPAPYDWDGLAFCSRPKYIQLLKDVGTDVVELAGDHFSDWGPDAVLYTLGLYKQEGWSTYGGGVNIDEARKPALFDVNGNKIAFIGCNAKPKGYALAGPDTPGALHCDMDQMAAEVKKLRDEGYQPIVTFQHLEYYAYTAHPILQKDFRQMADAGAIIISGSQAHQPHAFEFKDGAMLHYGLGNLFFDQTNQGDAPRTAFIDRHVFYDGKYIGTELLTIYLVDYARSRPMTEAERQTMLKTVFKASGW